MIYAASAAPGLGGAPRTPAQGHRPIQTYADAFSGTDDDGRAWTVRDLAERAAIGGLGTLCAGSGAETADQMESLVAETGVHGFNLAYVVTPGT